MTGENSQTFVHNIKKICLMKCNILYEDQCCTSCFYSQGTNILNAPCMPMNDHFSCYLLTNAKELRFLICCKMWPYNCLFPNNSFIILFTSNETCLSIKTYAIYMLFSLTGFVLNLTSHHINRRHNNIKFISLHPLLWINFMLDFICIGFAKFKRYFY